MKICILHRFPVEQIPETNAAIKYLRRENVDVNTFESFDRIHPIKKLLKSIWWVFCAWTLVWRKNYDVIYCDDSFPFYPIFVRLASPKSKMILRLGDLHLMYYSHGWLYNILHRIERIGWDMADKILVINSTMAKYVEQRTSSQVAIVFDPIDPSCFQDDIPFNFDEKHPIVMFHGTLTRNKDLDSLIYAARQLPHIKFFIIGDGEEYTRISMRAPSNVIMVGWQPFDLMRKWISTCDIGIAIRGNNRGNDFVITQAFLQYGVMGKPVVVSDRQVFRDMHYRWIFHNPNELSYLITKLLNKSRDDKTAGYYEGQSLQKYILQNHDARKIADEIFCHLSSAVKESA